MRISFLFLPHNLIFVVHDGHLAWSLEFVVFSYGDLFAGLGFFILGGGGRLSEMSFVPFDIFGILHRPSELSQSKIFNDVMTGNL